MKTDVPQQTIKKWGKKPQHFKRSTKIPAQNYLSQGKASEIKLSECPNLVPGQSSDDIERRYKPKSCDNLADSEILMPNLWGTAPEVKMQSRASYMYGKFSTNQQNTLHV